MLKQHRSHILRSLLFLKPYAHYSVSSLVVIMVGNAVAVALPLILRQVIDEGIEGGSLNVVLHGVILILALAVVQGLCTFFTGRWTEIASQNVAFDLRNKLHKKLHSLSFSYHDKTETGQLITRAISDVNRIRFLVGRAFLRLIEMIILVSGFSVSMILLNPPLAGLSLVIVPLLMYAGIKYGKILRPLSYQIQQAEGNLTSRLEQNLKGARIVQAFGQEETETRHFQAENSKLLDLQLLSEKTSAFYVPFMDMITQIGLLVILVCGGLMVIGKSLSLGGLVAFTTYMSQFNLPIRRFGRVLSFVAFASASSERIFEVLDTAPDIDDSPDARAVSAIRGSITFNHVSFAYGGDVDILTDISFKINPGEKVAILGVTGSGKSSIINLIPRFYDTSRGEICIDDQNIKNLTLKSLRDHIGMVIQDTILFATTIRENIAFSKPDASLDEITAAARAASIHDFIEGLPQQYDTQVGERGITLSGGQKQRISIARAILKDPKILILDDATSSVDTETEQQIQQALFLLMENRTSIIVAQRLSTVRQADMVLVLDRGVIDSVARRTGQENPHDILLKSSAIYREIFLHQLKHDNGEAQ